jgi:hypothetical protein
LDNLKWDSGEAFGNFEKGKTSGKLDQSQNQTKCGLIDRNKISSTGGKFANYLVQIKI